MTYTRGDILFGCDVICFGGLTVDILIRINMLDWRHVQRQASEYSTKKPGLRRR